MALVDGTSLPVVEDTSIADWVADVGKRIRLITKGVTGFVGQDIGAQQALTGAFGAPTFGGVNPADTDDYVIEDLTPITIAEILCEAPAPFPSALFFRDLDVTTAASSICREVEFDQCTLRGSFVGLGAFYLGCGFNGAGVGSTAGVSLFVTCTFMAAGVGVDVGNAAFTAVCAALGSVASGIQVRGGVAAFFADGSGNSACALVNNAANGLAVGSAGGGVDPSLLSPASAVVGALVWGIGNGAYGIRVGSASSVSYGDGTGGAIGGFLTVTGATNDSLVGGTPKAYGALPFFNAANGAGIVEAT